MLVLFPFPYSLLTVYWLGKPALAPSETSTVLQTANINAHIETFLEEAEEDMELDDLPPLENVTLIPVPIDQLPISAVLRSLPISHFAYSAPCLRYPRSVHYQMSTTRISQPSSY